MDHNNFFNSNNVMRDNSVIRNLDLGDIKMRLLYTISTIIAILLSLGTFFKIGDAESFQLVIIGICILPISIAIDKHDTDVMKHEGETNARKI